MPHQAYVLGFLLSPSHSDVVLIRKNRPKWQAGLLNGVGGKVEPGESPPEAMVREFREETGLETLQSQWREFAQLTGADFLITCFVTEDARWQSTATATDEPVEHCSLAGDELGAIYRNAVSSLPALLACALDPGKPYVTLTYRKAA